MRAVTWQGRRDMRTETVPDPSIKEPTDAIVPDGGTLLVLGLGPIGDMACRLAALRGLDVVGVDLVDERLDRVASRGVPVIDLRAVDDVAEAVRDRTDGRGADSVIDAVGMEAYGSPAASLAQRITAHLPDAIAEPLMQHAGVDRLAALNTAIDAVRRGGTVSLIGVYGGAADPLPMLKMFDKQLTVRMGQANVRRWLPDLWPLVTAEEDRLGLESFATQHLSLEDAPEAYASFQAKDPGFAKVVFCP